MKNLKKLFAVMVAAGSLAAAIPSAQAATATNTFTVDVTLTTSCTVGAIGTLTFTYASGQGGAAAGTGGGYNVTCTNGVLYNMSVDAGGTLVGLNYTLAVDTAQKTGSGAGQAYSVTGSIAGGQAGTCTAASCNATATHTVTVTY